MADGSVPICRLCLEVVYDGRFEEAESIIISLQNVLPELNFSVSSHPLVCRKCIETLQKSFNFKATCLDNEKYVQNYKTNGGSTIYLEEVVQNRCTENEVKMEKIDKGKICRFCLQMLEGEACVQLGVIEENMLAKCLPELDLTVSENPVICGTCLECLQNQFNFVMSCLDVEERIQNYCSIQGTNSSGQVNLHDIVVLPVKTEVDTFSHNDTATGIREVKAELEATLNAKTEPSKMEYEEVFIKDEVGPEGTQEDSLSDGDTSGDWLDSNNPDTDMDQLPHELDHDYINAGGPPLNGSSNSSGMSKSYKMKQFIKPRKEIQVLHALKKTIVQLEKKLKFYKDRYQEATDKLNKIQDLVLELRNKNLISEEAYQEIMACK